jgi:hypothetical protein
VSTYRGDARSDRVELAIAAGVKDQVVLATSYNEWDDRSMVPWFARRLKISGAAAVLCVDDAGVRQTVAPLATVRKDRFRRPAKENPPALFLTSGAANTLAKSARVRVSVRHLTREIAIPNVVGRLGPPSGECVLLCAPAGGSGYSAAVLVAAAKMLSRSPSGRRQVIVAIMSRPDLQPGGLDAFLAHPPVPHAKISAAVCLDEREYPDRWPRPSARAAIPGSLEVAQPGRASPELLTEVLEALGRNGFAGNEATVLDGGRAAVEACVAREIPAIGLLVTPGSVNDGLAAARAAADLVRALADREGRLSLPAR